MFILQSSHSEAAGQVYELTQDGRLLIQWADNTRSLCYPQELYLIGDEVRCTSMFEVVLSQHSGLMSDPSPKWMKQPIT